VPALQKKVLVSMQLDRFRSDTIRQQADDERYEIKVLLCFFLNFLLFSLFFVIFSPTKP